MNKWKCDRGGCENIAMGVGGAVGLEAIGWQMFYGTELESPTLLCPAHRTPTIFHNGEDAPATCTICESTIAATIIQRIIAGPMNGCYYNRFALHHRNL